MDKLQELISRCRNAVSVDVNTHRNYYESVEEHISGYGDGNEAKDIEDFVLKTMIETDTLVEVQFYPDSATGFYTVRHYDVGLAIEEALRILDNSK